MTECDDDPPRELPRLRRLFAEPSILEKRDDESQTQGVLTVQQDVLDEARTRDPVPALLAQVAGEAHGPGVEQALATLKDQNEVHWKTRRSLLADRAQLAAYVLQLLADRKDGDFCPCCQLPNYLHRHEPECWMNGLIRLANECYGPNQSV